MTRSANGSLRGPPLLLPSTLDRRPRPKRLTWVALSLGLGAAIATATFYGRAAHRPAAGGVSTTATTEARIEPPPAESPRIGPPPAESPRIEPPPAPTVHAAPVAATPVAATPVSAASVAK